MNKVKDRIIFADILRILTTFFVIIFHVSIDKWYPLYDKTLDCYIFTFFVSDLRWCVPVFFMLSGMIFLNPNKNITKKALYTKYIPRILFALFLWSFAYKILAAIIKQINGIQSITLDSINQILSNILFEPAWMHLWFLYPLIAIYMLVPILRVFTKSASKNDYIYLFMLYFTSVGIFPLIEANIGKSILLFKIDQLYGYTTYFIMGWFLYHYKLNSKQTKTLYLLGIISAISIFLITIYKSNQYGGPYISIVFNYLSILNLFMTCAIFLFIMNLFKERYSISIKLSKYHFIEVLSSCCFGIYLTHMISFNLIYSLYDKYVYNYPITSLFITSIIIFIISFFITYIIKQIPFFKNWIV